jgi:hypothetical protein
VSYDGRRWEDNPEADFDHKTWFAKTNDLGQIVLKVIRTDPSSLVDIPWLGVMAVRPVFASGLETWTGSSWFSLNTSLGDKHETFYLGLE